MLRVNNELAALGARGVSLVFASGDSGYAREQKFPAASPHVTSVGGAAQRELKPTLLVRRAAC
jgi:subtilase family serine protease